jgi:hypothetical protein
METKFVKSFRKIVAALFYLFVFLFPWQTKIILRASSSNFNEISLYLSHLLLLVVVALFFIHKIKRREQDDAVPVLWWAIVVLDLAVLISFFVAGDQVLAGYYYLVFLEAIALFYLLFSGFKSENYEEPCFNRTALIYSWLSGVWLQAIFGVYQFLQQAAPAFKYLGLARHDASVLGTSIIEAASGRWLRAYGGFDHPNIFGGVLVVALIIIAYLLAQKKVIRSAKEIGESVFLFIVYFTCLFALFFSFSRAAWLALLVGLLYLFVVFLIKKDYWVLGRFVVLLIFSLLMVALIAFPYRDLLVVRVSDTARLEVKSINERQEYLVEARDMISQHWLLGVGPGNYVSVLQQQDANKKAAWDYQPVHNVFLLWWAQSGLLALVSFIALLFLLKRDSHNLYAGALLSALLVIMLLDHWLISLPFGILFLFLTLGLM